jgi:hypothetical protein
MSAALHVSVNDLGGNRLELSLQASDTVGQIRTAICAAWTDLDPKGFRLLAGAKLLADDTVASDLEFNPLVVQLVKFDPLPGLGHFVESGHHGIEVRASGDGCSTLVKLSAYPDSNNVTLRHAIGEPCFVEFNVARSRDEISIGVATDIERVEQTEGFSNLSLKSTWVYSKRQAMPTLFFGGQSLNPEDVPSYGEGDRIAVFVDPEERLVKFYKNGDFVASNLPWHPLPSAADRADLRIYAMLDATRDEISIIRFGPGEPSW